MKYMSNNRRKLEAKKWEAYNQIPVDYCKGCLTKDGLTRSHTLSVKKHPEFIGDLRNIYVLCYSCHDKVERSRFHELIYGEEIVRNMFELDKSSAIVRIYKMLDIIGEDLSNAPEWVSELKNELEL